MFGYSLFLSVSNKKKSGILPTMDVDLDRRYTRTQPGTIPEALRINLHTHSAFSDGQFTPEALVLQAIDRGVTILGITDHYFTRKTPSIRTTMLERYIEELERLEDVYKEDLTLMKGLELNTLEMLLTGLDLPEASLLARLDYVLLEYVANIPRAGVPLKNAIQLASEIPVPTGLAHTDLAMAFPGEDPETLVIQLADADLFVELNDAYHRPGERYPFYFHYAPYLEKASEHGLTFSAGMDVHGPITGFSGRAITVLMGFGLEGNLFYLKE